MPNPISSQAKEFVPEGFQLIAVKNLEPLVTALCRAESKGDLPYALIEEWEAFDYRILS